MLLEDDDRPKNGKPALKKLDNMSVSELQEYVVALKEEILRVEADITKKKSHQEALSGFFKKKEE